MKSTSGLLVISGNIQGVINGLDRIKSLGANVIWLMPIYPIGEVNSVNSPYSVKNYTQVNPEFGSRKSIQTLVKTAHDKGIAVILDWVANHTTWENALSGDSISLEDQFDLSPYEYLIVKR